MHPTNTIRVTNIPDETSESELCGLFRKFGPVLRLYPSLKDHETLASRGYAHVTFAHHANAIDAMAYLEKSSYKSDREKLLSTDIHMEWAAAPSAPNEGRYSGPCPSEMTPEQLSLRDSILSSRPTTGLSGPFGPWLAVPKIAGPAQQLGSTVRYGTSLSFRESELVILLTGAKFESATEFEIHVGEARRAGVGWDVIRSIPREGFSLEKVKECVISMLEKENNNGNNPPGLAHEKTKAREVAIVLFAAELLHTNTVCDKTYAETRRLLDGRDSALVEITAIVGYYAFVSYTLNVFKIPSPSTEQHINE
jgi:4-carboxymuconolactone decarboxylase